MEKQDILEWRTDATHSKQSSHWVIDCDGRFIKSGWTHYCRGNNTDYRNDCYSLHLSRDMLLALLTSQYLLLVRNTIKIVSFSELLSPMRSLFYLTITHYQIKPANSKARAKRSSQTTPFKGPGSFKILCYIWYYYFLLSPLQKLYPAFVVFSVLSKESCFLTHVVIRSGSFYRFSQSSH